MALKQEPAPNMPDHEQAVTDDLKPKKPSKKKFVLIGGGLILITFLVIVGVLARVQTSVQPADNNSQDAKTPTTQHLALVAEGKIKESRSLLKNPDVINLEQYEFLWGTFVPDTYDLSSCEIMVSENNIDKVYCPNKEDISQGTRLDYTIIDGRIDKIEVVTNG